jgi:hypothetical protein
MAAMVYSCTGANRLRARPRDEAIAAWDLGAGVAAGEGVAALYQFSLKPAAMVLFSVGWPTSVTEVVM